MNHPFSIKNKKMKTKDIQINRMNFFLTMLFIGWVIGTQGRENIGSVPNVNQYKSVMSGCANATQQVDLDINNVRAKILNGGDMWWDIFGTGKAAYAVP